MQKRLCPIAKGAIEHPSFLALVTPYKNFSYRELEQEVQKAQLYLSRFPPAILGIIATLDLMTITLYFAALREGFSVCMLNPKEPLKALTVKVKELRLKLITPPHHLPHSTQEREIYIKEDMISTYLYTSGSSASPKIAALTFKNHYYSALGIIPTLQLNSASRYLLSLPLYHVAGLSILYRTFMSSGALILSEKDSLVNSVLENKQISHLSLVSTQYLKLLENTSLPTTLVAILLGGSFIPQLEQGLDKKLPLYLSYGLTEMASTVCCAPLTSKNSSCGWLLPYRELNISSEGEIFVQGETLFKGYYDTHSHQILSQEGWFKTGDLGSYHEEKGLLLRGRTDRLIISGGENIQPEEIETSLRNIVGIEQAVIIALADPLFGEKMVAFVKGSSSLNLSSLSSKLSSYLPSYKIPKHYLPWPPSIPCEITQKISSAVRKQLHLHALKDQSL